jgi:hypothetical protein
VSSPAKLCDPAGRVVFFPVRHHSPACARLVVEWIERTKPAAVLIEGPSDFNDRIDELLLPHELPVAIYSYVRLPDGQRRGAFYPFCEYSPEWQAVRAAAANGAEIRFIDLPWADVAGSDPHAHRYADARLGRGLYIHRLCDKLGLDNFHALWDTLIELDREMPVEEYLRRAHHFCYHVRVLDEQVDEADRSREAFMAAMVRQALEKHDGPVLVVTGGYHSYALHARLVGESFVGTDEPAEIEASAATGGEERGIALTPYSYERLDSLTGYDSGMPNPGFYDRVWQDRRAGQPLVVRGLLTSVVEALRERGQPVSTADLIAVRTAAETLAALRGHREIWRWDLIDAVTGALVKEELEYDCGHPFLEAVHEVFRGGKQGRLAAGTPAPPLVRDIERQLQQHGLTPVMRAAEHRLDLTDPPQRQRSQVLHRLRLLSIEGFRHAGGTDFLARDDLAELVEIWEVRWSPEFDAGCIESARYGPTLEEAAAARLVEQCESIERDAERAAALLVQASLAGLSTLASDFHRRLEQVIRQDGNFATAAAALGHLLYLYRYDEVLGTSGRDPIGTLLSEAFQRALWLFESLGQVGGPSAGLLDGVSTLIETFRQCEQSLDLDRTAVIEVLSRVETDQAQLPAMRGAAVGGLWNLGVADTQQALADMRLFAEPEKLGDFLSGLFCLARELIQREESLLLAVDELVVGFHDDEFLEALPALRLAFTYFTPREKHHLATTLMEALGLAEQRKFAELEVDAATAARAIAFESRLFETARRFAVRGADA